MLRRTTCLPSRVLAMPSARALGASVPAPLLSLRTPRRVPSARSFVPVRSFAASPPDTAWAHRNTAEFTQSLRRVMKLLSDRGDWCMAEAHVPSEDGALLPTSVFKTMRGSVWRERHAELAELRAKHASAAPDSSLVAQVYASGQPMWLYNNGDALDVAAIGGDARAPIFASLSAHCGLLLPVHLDGRVVAVITFMSADDRAQDERLMSEMETVAPGMLSAGLSSFSSTPFSSSLYPSSSLPIARMNAIFHHFSATGLFSESVAYSEIDWFFRQLRVDEAYHRLFSEDEVAQHMAMLIAAKKMAEASGDKENIVLDAKLPNGHLFIVPSGMEPFVERKIESRWRKELEKGEWALSTSMFRSEGTAIQGGTKHLLVYVVRRSTFPANENEIDQDESDLNKIATVQFLQEKPDYVKKAYQEVIGKTIRRMTPVFHIVGDTKTGSKQLMFAFRSARGYFSLISMLCRQQGLQLERRFSERFANGLRVYSMFVKECADRDEKIARVIHSISLLHAVPTTSPLMDQLRDNEISPQEFAYAVSVSSFLPYFIHKSSDDYMQLVEAVKKSNIADDATLARLTSLRAPPLSLLRITQCLQNNIALLKLIYTNFREISVAGSKEGVERMEREVRRTVHNETDELILLAMIRFNQCVLKTNFFCQRKTSLAFRMSKEFVPSTVVIERPHAVFLVIGSSFQGFHVRFREVSRGGIRLIPFTNLPAYERNRESQFRETYGLAFTQNKKNKDIPEFGSKGTILMDPAVPDTQPARLAAFQQYTSALLDLIIPNEDNVHMDKKVLIDHIGSPELLFLGPDENTADYMEWAALYARSRGYKQWKSLTTGKPPSIGGIPHDTYGMTTRSVHQFVTGVLGKLDENEGEITKLQTGGPDGDLGSNEILISHDVTTSIVDGSGVLHDPNGLNRDELSRLAHQRGTCDHFDQSLLSKDGFFVSIDDRDVTLPDGTAVESGLHFRNEFHLNEKSSADLFVPCGGRPESVTLQNVNKLFNGNSPPTPRFRFIVEGANLFLSQEARAVLERAGVILYKDASANKGGVTSSSLEVLAALALLDAEFEEHMCVKEGVVPPFYSAYVQDVIATIEENATLEFECIWREHERSGEMRHVLTDEISDKINHVNDFITNSTLFDDVAIRRAVLQRVIPKSLQELVGFDTVLQRVPAPYSRALFSSYVASRYIYRYGLEAPEVAFFSFMRDEFLKENEN